MKMAAPDRQLSRVERAARVRALLASGMTTREIAAAWGLAPTSIRALVSDPTGEKQLARRERYRRPCASCGRLLSGADGPTPREGRSGLCIKCVASVVWTRPKIIAAFWLFAAKYSRPPTVYDADPALARQAAYQRRASAARQKRLLEQAEAFHRDGLLPSATTVYDRFGGWTAALLAAGFDRNRRGRPSKRNVRPEREGSSGRTLLRDCGNPDDDRTPSIGLPSESPD